MFKKIVVPVDLRHLDQQERALAVSADAARHYGAGVTYVAATPSAPSSVARSPEAFADKLRDFAAARAAQGGFDADAHMFIVNDLTGDLDHYLAEEIAKLDPDLVIMASHRPGAGDYFWPSHGGRVATHVPASVLLVREDVGLSG
ncbi:universal stress protein [Limimaricola hongkongensis]|uniref:Universal stress protein (Usp) n=1 Tax=Limimaricola hongkongensis DSM 17492 TaxID=1122180 RepID=A0A017HEN7_9RHOB|nr:universal stress protein [Limimaricola hongkongensis]EYD72780.1 Universal stress protein (Usp) [Limimaricola hongkongensis DSM 17492]